MLLDELEIRKTTLEKEHLRLEEMFDSRDIEPYSERDEAKWANSKFIEIYKGDNSHVELFINKSRESSDYRKKLYFGKISEKLSNRINEATGIELKGFNVSISADEVRKIFKDHGDEEGEKLLGQRAIEIKDIAIIPMVIAKFDSAIRSERDYDGKPVIKFKKKIKNETINVTGVVSDKRLDLRVQTEFVNIKRSLHTPSDANAPVSTSKTSSAIAP